MSKGNLTTKQMIRNFSELETSLLNTKCPVSLLNWVCGLFLFFFFNHLHLCLLLSSNSLEQMGPQSEGNWPSHLCPQMSRQQCGTSLQRQTCFPVAGMPLGCVRNNKAAALSEAPGI